MWGLGCSAEGVGCRVQGVGCSAQGVGCRVTEEGGWQRGRIYAAASPAPRPLNTPKPGTWCVTDVDCQ